MLEYTHKRPSGPSPDVWLLEALRNGPQTIDTLSLLSGLSWSQVFNAIDRLSRSGHISLQRLPVCEYQVSLNQSGA